MIRWMIMVLLGVVSIVTAQQSPHGKMTTPCENCHTTDSWKMRKDAKFNHAATKFALTGQHRAIACASCHPGLKFGATSTACSSCHTDVHAGELGTECARCHTTRAWSVADMRRRHDETRFPLLGPHATAECAACHKGEPGRRFRGMATTCIGCHQQDFTDSKNPNHPGAGFSTDCLTCHRSNASRWTSGFDHGLTGFALTGAHTRPACSGCHVNNIYRGRSSACVSCHQANFTNTTNPNHVTGGFPQFCEKCHTTTAWTPSTFDHNATAFALTGAHRSIVCTDCHVNGQYANMPTACSGCHMTDYNGTTNPSHVSGQFSQNCTQCHTTTAWRPAAFDHANTRFLLTGAHVSVSCATCHVNNNYQLVYASCYQCHQQDYAGTSSPNHATAQFPQTCERCHSTIAWKPSTFNHSTTAFPLTGAHLAVSCGDCHKNGQYAGTPTACSSCHLSDFNGTTNPNHAALQFSQTCSQCHTTTAWKPASFNHTTTRFALTGAHTTVTCTNCHVNGNYQLTYTDCYQCHQTDYTVSTSWNHTTLLLSHACETCHTTTAWMPPTFNHDTQFFRIKSGKHQGKWTACSQCHPTYSDYKQFTCLSCHEHNKTSMDADHTGKTGYVYASPNCYSCHRNV